MNVLVDWAQIGGSVLGSVWSRSSSGWTRLISWAPPLSCPMPGWGWNSWGSSGLSVALHTVSPHAGLEVARLFT